MREERDPPTNRQLVTAQADREHSACKYMMGLRYMTYMTLTMEQQLKDQTSKTNSAICNMDVENIVPRRRLLRSTILAMLARGVQRGAQGDECTSCWAPAYSLAAEQRNHVQITIYQDSTQRAAESILVESDVEMRDTCVSLYL